ncbi:unnamed protein product [Effrenium voratum]|uniref:Uncharacterized protein n=1 Tax=Effrenium voratum TaxID=2562239 RepID=A0AA36HRC9_9DINO|nr:unnamed protein product [Effrenium voratum]
MDVDDGLAELLLRPLAAPALLALRGASRHWRCHVAAATAWGHLFRRRFGRAPDGELSWLQNWAAARRYERETFEGWDQGALKPETVMSFASFVRSWASDEELLVAGLSSGQLQAVKFDGGARRFLFEGAHGDEVVALALNQRYVFSGSGDPGYHRRQPRDASVRLWSREGKQLGAFVGHLDSVRAVALFQQLPDFGLSGGMDCHVVLWDLKAGKRCSLPLPRPCRCLRVLCEDFQDSRARVLAGFGNSVAELAVSARASGASLTPLKFVYAHVEVSSLSCFPPEESRWPKSFLSSMKVALGSVDGHFALLQGGRCRALRELFQSENMANEVVSLVLLSETRVLLVTRAGILSLLAWEGLGQPRLLWSKSGWRMYVSTIGLWGSRRLVSDGFDDTIRTFTLCPKVAEPGYRKSPLVREKKASPSKLGTLLEERIFQRSLRRKGAMVRG